MITVSHPTFCCVGVGLWLRWGWVVTKLTSGLEALEEEEKPNELVKHNPKAVLLVPSPKNSELTQVIRKVIVSLCPCTGIPQKVVQRAGEKLEDILHTGAAVYRGPKGPCPPLFHKISYCFRKKFCKLLCHNFLFAL